MRQRCKDCNLYKLNDLNNMEDNSRTLVVYFSYTAGNTRRIAEKVSKTLGADIVALEPEVPYSNDYDKGPGHVIKNMTEAAEHKGAKVEKGNEFRFSPSSGHRNEMKTSEEELDKWIESLK